MANICENTFYAYTENEENLKTIEKFFDSWYLADVNITDNTIECYFDSKWTFPEEQMKDLYESIPNKEDIYMRCLSVEYGCMYHALWECDEDGWREV